MLYIVHSESQSPNLSHLLPPGKCVLYICDSSCSGFFVFWLSLMACGGEGNGTPLQDSCLENPMDRGAWWAAVHEVAKSQTRLSDFTFTFHFHALEKEMATLLQCSCLESPRDGGAWWAAVCGVAQSRTRLKQLSSSSSSRACGVLVCQSGVESEVRHWKHQVSAWTTREFPLS